jgi:hypothetical protein
MRWLTYKDHTITEILLEDIPMLPLGKGAVVLLDLPDPFKQHGQGETLRQLVSQVRKDRLKILSEVQTQ